ncbi:hypothetical protein [Rhodovulum sp. 12E13]|uniref:hypothetical protein n=1 Tax=Rhodovulum sp. 12E13 TaxID=2203891 RepID=UPI0018F73DB3|nr:hypothetical protein [Rhodovulum sp. 12E13]
MLAHPTSDKLIALGLAGMAKALDEQRCSAVADSPLVKRDQHARPPSRTSLKVERATNSARRRGSM